MVAGLVQFRYMYNVKSHDGIVRGVGGEALVKSIGSVDLTAWYDQSLHFAACMFPVLVGTFVSAVSFTFHKRKLYAGWSGNVANFNGRNLWKTMNRFPLQVLML